MEIGVKMVLKKFWLNLCELEIQTVSSLGEN